MKNKWFVTIPDNCEICVTWQNTNEIVLSLNSIKSFDLTKVLKGCRATDDRRLALELSVFDISTCIIIRRHKLPTIKAKHRSTLRENGLKKPTHFDSSA